MIIHAIVLLIVFFCFVSLEHLRFQREPRARLCYSGFQIISRSKLLISCVSKSEINPINGSTLKEEPIEVPLDANLGKVWISTLT